jgi:UDP-2,3-diacylglucosamine pyrophosphatase LpxH
MSDRIDKAFKNAPRIPITDSSKIVLVSDCHRGTGDHNDNFADNENTYITAMRRYFAEGFTYIELGDGDELWETRKFGLITDENNHVFRLLSEFRREGRLHMVYGNHDMVKKSPKWRKKHLATYHNERTHCELPLFGDMDITEGLILDYSGVHGERRFRLLHGHQGDLICDRFWLLGRFLVRNVWRPMELIGLKDPRSTAENRRKQNKIERRLSSWAKNSGDFLIAGHTHRPRFPHRGAGERSDFSHYFNTGSCVHPRCITAIEISGGAISLVKWSVESRRDGVLFIGKTILEGPTSIVKLSEQQSRS